MFGSKCFKLNEAIICHALTGATKDTSSAPKEFHFPGFQWRIYTNFCLYIQLSSYCGEHCCVPKWVHSSISFDEVYSRQRSLWAALWGNINHMTSLATLWATVYLGVVRVLHEQKVYQSNGHMCISQGWKLHTFSKF